MISDRREMYIITLFSHKVRLGEACMTMERSKICPKDEYCSV